MSNTQIKPGDIVRVKPDVTINDYHTTLGTPFKTEDWRVVRVENGGAQIIKDSYAYNMPISGLLVLGNGVNNVEETPAVPRGLKPGDVVKLKSGGPRMTVVGVSDDGGKASVIWIAGAHHTGGTVFPQQTTIPTIALELDEDES